MFRGLFVTVDNFDQYALGPGPAQEFYANRDAECGRRRWWGKTARDDNCRETRHRTESAVAFHLGLAYGYDQPLLMRVNNRVEAIIGHDFHNALLQFCALLKTQAIAVVQFEALRFFDDVADVRVKLS